ncbi:hypothetical protein EG349_11960 [Chryseobacterium shandongense]|uniref:Lipoprotein n=1 Tax=Chryseobacterium shandongense TaxID=1493872 RepID=A0A3G6MVP4_9FLAO|nr:hypothetical protein [Chryseobacterium shandongense]AZA59277.1 hypothetical protein EG350_19695 [Chryseobacterium shandongense]AZA87455.1 hypothetical protein EG349_11960 [Chryseobacterium shandongense]AZA95956.1 hypothetical protein EG353_10425 [Chryseobacterium shandongense]
MKKKIITTVFSSILLMMGCKNKEQKFLEKHKVILYNTKEADNFINNSVVKPIEAKKLQADFAIKNNKDPEMYSFFIIDNNYVFTSYFQPKIPNASVRGIWVNATTGKSKYVKEDVRLTAYLPYLEEGEKYPF